MQVFILTFLLVAVLEDTATKDKKSNDVQEVVEEHDMCVGCDDKDKKEEEKKQEDPPLNVEIVLDPETGKVRYIIKGIEIK